MHDQNFKDNFTKLKNVAKMGLDVALNFSLALLNRTSINKKKIKLGIKIAKSHILTLQNNKPVNIYYITYGFEQKTSLPR